MSASKNTHKGERVEKRLSYEDANLKRIKPYLELCEKREKIKVEKSLYSNANGDRKCGQIKAWYEARQQRQDMGAVAAIATKKIQ